MLPGNVVDLQTADLIGRFGGRVAAEDFQKGFFFEGKFRVKKTSFL